MLEEFGKAYIEDDVSIASKANCLSLRELEQATRLLFESRDVEKRMTCLMGFNPVENSDKKDKVWSQMKAKKASKISSKRRGALQATSTTTQ